MEKIQIASLDINVDELVKSTIAVKTEMDGLIAINKQLAVAVKLGSEESRVEQLKNEITIKQLGAAYRENIKAITSNKEAATQMAKAEQLVNSALKNEIHSIDEARANVSLLTKVRNATNTSTEEGKATVLKLNEAINANNKYVKDNADGYLKLKLNIGNYKEDMREAINESNLFNDALGKVSQPVNAVLIGFKQVKGEITNMTNAYANAGTAQKQYQTLQAQATTITNAANAATKEATAVGFKYAAGTATKAEVEAADTAALTLNTEAEVANAAATEAATVATEASTVATKLFGLALAATGIGIILLLIGALVSSFKSSEDSGNKLTKVMSVFGGIIGTVNKALKPFVDLLINYVGKYLEFVGGLAEKAAETFASLAETLGFDGVAQSVRGVVSAVKENIKAASELADAEAKLQKAQRESRKVQLEYQKEAEKLRQLRDDEAKSIPERIAANDKLGATLKKQAKDELAIAYLKLAVAQKNIKVTGESTEALDKLAEAQTEIADIQERISGQESEQLANLNSLRKEAADKQKEYADKQKEINQKRLDDLIKLLQAELAILEQEQGLLARDAAGRIRIAEQIRDKKLQIAQQEYNASKKTAADGLNLDKARNEANFQLLSVQTATIVEAASREVEVYKNKNARILEDGKIFNDELLAQKTAIVNETAALEIAAEKAKFDALLITEQEYNDAKDVINADAKAKRDELALQNKEAEANAQLIDLENKKVAEEENFIAVAQLEKDRNAILMAQELEAAKTNGANIADIKAKYAAIDKKLDEQTNAAKVQLAADAFGNIATLVGENTAVGKAAAIAQATINTYQAATAAYSALAGITIVGPVLGAIAAGVAVAAGLANVKKIASTKTPKAAKGATIKLGGNYHSNGGNTLYDRSGLPVIEAEKNELIGTLNRNASAQFMSFNDAFLNKPSASFSSAGGAISKATNAATDLTPIGAMFKEAVIGLPSPVVILEDIDYGLKDLNRVKSNGDLG